MSSDSIQAIFTRFGGDMSFDYLGDGENYYKKPDANEQLQKTSLFDNTLKTE